MVQKFNIPEELMALDKFWHQRELVEANGQLIRVAKGLGSTERHKHDDQDELFLVIKGKLEIEFDREKVTLKPGEMCVVPKGEYHRPMALGESHFVVIGTSRTDDKAGGKPN